MKKARKSKGAVAVRDTAAVPAYLAGYKGQLGTEDIANEDISIPRIKLAQSMSDEVKSGLRKDGDLFLNIDGSLLAEAGKPLHIVVLARGKEYILWRPRKDGGGILARANPVRDGDQIRYAWDKPNQSFEVKVDGKIKVTWKTKNYIDEDGLDQWGSEIPGNKESGIAATAHHNYVVVLPDNNDMLAALSLSKSQTKRAKDFNAMLKMGGRVPVFGRVFTVTTVDEKNDQGEFKNVKIAVDGFVDQEQFALYGNMAAGFVGKVINVDHSEPEDEIDERK